MAQITHLTPEQEAYLPIFRDKWLALGRSTEPSDRARSERGVRSIYAVQDMRYPADDVVWVDSPKAALVYAKTVLGLDLDLSMAPSGGQFRLYTIAWLRFGQEIGVKYAHPEWLDALEDADQCGWWIPCDDAVIFVERPSILTVDGQGRLHNTTGPAIQYRDGWGVWAIRGVRVPRYVVEEPHEITIAKLLSESNEEVRSVMLDRMDPDLLVADGGLEYISEHPDPCNEPYMLQLYRIPDTFFGTGRWGVLCTNATAERDGTRRKYLLSAPLDLDGDAKATIDAIDVMAWINSTTRETYLRLGRAC